ncbi:hypothetical protein SE17_03125 [Kouleothrix aurantiaca]|uniref:Uncharacterized protein n=1 Tax=Kouleothrix aurantiaca TaxID=186479 RepID=A0A0P9FMP1_9CHLR|nr:hypothetical protein SE17_03125 [Kouleothrix aurantiaca]
MNSFIFLFCHIHSWVHFAHLNGLRFELCFMDLRRNEQIGHTIFEDFVDPLRTSFPMGDMKDSWRNILLGIMLRGCRAGFFGSSACNGRLSVLDNIHQAIAAQICSAMMP